MFNIENKSYAYFTRDSSPNVFKFDAINDQFEKRDNTSGWDVMQSDDETISVFIRGVLYSDELSISISLLHVFLSGVTLLWKTEVQTS